MMNFCVPRLKAALLILVFIANLSIPSMTFCAITVRDLSGAWYGNISRAKSPAIARVSALFIQPVGNQSLSGTLNIGDGHFSQSGVVDIAGKTRGNTLSINGIAGTGSNSLTWLARWSNKAGNWRGTLRIRSGKTLVDQGIMTLSRAGGAVPPTCGNQTFISNIQPMFETKCLSCHSAGGAGASTRFRVIAGDSKSTVINSARLVNVSRPLDSRLLLKAKKAIRHPGPAVIMPGSSEELSLIAWIAEITTPACNIGTNVIDAANGIVTGDEIYQSNCAICHGSTAYGNRTDVPDIHCNKSIHNAVRNGQSVKAYMPNFPMLSDSNISAIQGYLSDTLCPAGTATGADLYASNCKTCHAPDGSGAIQNTPAIPPVRCSIHINDAVTFGRGDKMPSFSFVDAEKVSLQDYLGALCTNAGRSDLDLYESNCWSCHGDGAKGRTNALGVTGSDIHCAKNIAPILETGLAPDMPAFNFVLANDVTNLQGYLNGLCPSGSVSGADLFKGNCSSCHGTSGQGVTGKGSAMACNKAVGDPIRHGRIGPDGAMPPFPALTDSEISQIQSFLAELCPAGTASGAEIYASNCSSCHGVDDAGTTTAPGIRCSGRIAAAVVSGLGTMPAFRFSSGEITAVSDYLGQLCTSSSTKGQDVYNGNCWTCHGIDGHGRTNSQNIQGPDIHCSKNVADPVINGRPAGMPSFPELFGDINNLQDYVNTLCPAGTVTGKDLFLSNCSQCHGATGAGISGKGSAMACNRNVADPIRLGESGPDGNMPSFPTITENEIGSIQNYLLELCPVGTASGEELFKGNCSRCHGSNGEGITGFGAPMSCNRNISDAARKGRSGIDGNMPLFAALSDAELERIQVFMISNCPLGSVDGPTLIAQNCANCHSPDNDAQQIAPDIQCATRLKDAVQQGRGAAMPPFPALTESEYQSISDALATKCQVGGRTGKMLWMGNCATCHGWTGLGRTNAQGITGLDVNCNSLADFEDRIRLGGSIMPAFPMLAVDPSDAKSIHDWLVSSYCLGN